MRESLQQLQDNFFDVMAESTGLPPGVLDTSLDDQHREISISIEPQMPIQPTAEHLLIDQ